MHLRRTLGLLAALGMTTLALHAEDWPQWRGVNRDGNWTDTGIVRNLSLIHI